MKNQNKKMLKIVSTVIATGLLFLNFINSASANYVFYNADTGRTTFSNNIEAPNLDMPLANDWRYIRNGLTNGGLRLGTGNGAGVYTNGIEISAGGGYIKLNHNTTLNVATSEYTPSTANFSIQKAGEGYGLFSGVSGSGNAWLQSGTANDVTNYNLILQSRGGNVGIGVGTPIAKLQVEGVTLGSFMSGNWHPSIDRNILYNANVRYTVTQSGPAPFNLTALFDGILDPSYVYTAPSVGNPQIITISGLPGTHTQTGAYFGFTTRYLAPKRFKVEGYDSYGGANVWRTIADYTNTDYNDYEFFVKTPVNGGYTQLRMTIYACPGTAGPLCGLSELFFVHPEGGRPYAGLIPSSMNEGLNGNVGIGTANPGAYKLNVQGGQINSSGGFCISGDCKTSWGQVGTTDWITDGLNNLKSSNDYYNVQIGTQVPASDAKLEVNGKVVVTNGNVGIGTTNPTYPLDIYSNSSVSNYSPIYYGIASFSRDGVIGQNLSVTNTGGGGPPGSVFGTYSEAIGSGSYTDAVGVFGRSSGTYVNWGLAGYGVSSSSHGSKTGGLTVGSSYSGAGSAVAYGAYIDTVSNTSANTGSNAYGIYINSVTASGGKPFALYSNTSAPSYFAGNVGIGTTNPGSKFSILKNSTVANENEGAMEIASGFANTNAKLILGTVGTSYSYIQSMQQDYSWANRPLLLQPNDGTVGIGLTNPAQKLDVAGNIAMNNKTAFYGYDSWLRINEGNAFSNGIYVGTSVLRTDGELQVGGNGDKFLVKGAKVGIANTNPLATLDVSGSIGQNGHYKKVMNLPWPGDDSGNGKWYIRLRPASSGGAGLHSVKVTVQGTWSWSPIMGWLTGEYSFHAPANGSISSQSFNVTSASGYALENLRLGPLEIENGWISIPVWSANSNNVEATVEYNDGIINSYITNTGWMSSALPQKNSQMIQGSLSVGERLQMGHHSGTWINDAIGGWSNGFSLDDAVVFTPLSNGTGQSDLRMIIADDPNDSFSIWGNTCAGGACDNLNAASVVAHFRADGSVGIGTTNPGYKLQVTGDIGATAFTYSSDRSLKKNIETIKNPLGKILNLRGVTFDWKADSKSSVGLIAQEVEKVFPELVTESNGIKSVQYGNLVAPLIEAVKEQQRKINNLEARINILENNK